MKTRLGAAIGPERATRLYEAFLHDLEARLRVVEAEIEVWWAYWPPEAPFADVVRSDRIFSQEGPDLGARLQAAMERVRGGAERPVAAIGVDAPHLPIDALRTCRGALARGVDLVLGPATDGGYYLIGTRAPQPQLFDRVAWGTPTVCEETRARARRTGLRVVELVPLDDVDDLRGLRALAAVLRHQPGTLPRTERLLSAALR